MAAREKRDKKTKRAKSGQGRQGPDGKQPEGKRRPSEENDELCPQTPGKRGQGEDGLEHAGGSDQDRAEQAVCVRPRPASEWSSGSGEEDVDLIRRFLSGDQEAFTRLVIKYQNKVHNLCYRILGDRDEAKDMAQEVFITVHKSLKNFRGESLFSTWVFRVTANHCKNRIKYLGRRHYYHSTSLDQPQEMEDGEVYVELQDNSPTPESELASEEVQAVVQQAISSLDADHRIVIVLRDIQDLSYEEIADLVGIKVGTVKSRIHRARNDLKKKLESSYKRQQKKDEFP